MDQQTTSTPSPHYTVFVRLPFPRNDFEDPEPVEWDATKDKALWKRISKASNSKDLDWESMSSEFGVTLSFLLQQAAWLYERHFEGMRLQMKKLGGVTSGAPSPKPSAVDEHGFPDGAPGAVSIPMSRLGSKDSAMHRPSTSSGDAGSLSSTPRTAKPMTSRTSSANTVAQSRIPSSSFRKPPQPTLAEGPGAFYSRPPLTTLDSSRDDDSRPEHDSTSGSDFDGSRRVASTPADRRPQINKKTPRRPGTTIAEDEDEDDDSNGYLPFASTYQGSKEDPAATLRGSPKKPTTRGSPAYDRDTSSKQTESSTSSADRRDSNDLRRENSDRPTALSPRHRAQLEQLSPRYKKSGSEGSPSMGSSFSDLDDASVTQSALEDALLSNMQYGSIGLGIGSRISSIREGLGRNQSS